MSTRQNLILALCMVLACNCMANTIYVRLDGKGDADTIQGGIDLAVYGDTVLVADGTYTGVGNRNLVLNGIGVTVESENGPELCTIDAEGAERIFYIVHEDPNSIIRGFTMTGGYDSGGLGGGAIYIHQTHMTIENCVFEHNSANRKGGALSIWVSTATVKDCVIRSNSAIHATSPAEGGGVHLPNPQGTIFENCTITDNSTSGQGGGIFMDGGTATFKDTIIRSNRAESVGYASHGGGIKVKNHVQLTLTNCELIDNFSSYNGAGIHAEYGSASITNCLFEANDSDKTGGGIYNFGGPLDIYNSTFVSNHSGFKGGGCFLSSNAANPSSVLLHNSIFWQNVSDSNGDELALNGASTAVNLSFSDIDQGKINNSLIPAIINDLGGNINDDPNFAEMGYDNGGNWVAGDYHLRSLVGRYDPVISNWVTDLIESSCIDAGDPADTIGDEPYPHGNRANMGFHGRTVEAGKSPTCSGTVIGDFTNDCRVNIADFAEFALHWLECNIDPHEFCW